MVVFLTKKAYKPSPDKKPLDKTKLPIPIFDANLEFIDLYWKAWELAWDHVVYNENFPQSPYMDEACWADTIWIWDTCFMVLFCKYAPDLFPGIESLNNFYETLYEKKKIPLKIQHLDNPPLFAWVELEYYYMTGDMGRLKWLFSEKKYLQQHFDFIEGISGFTWRPKVGRVPLFLRKKKNGYQWAGTPSGMDNTPRGQGKYSSILWVDLLAQQALSAQRISKIASILQNQKVADNYQSKYLKLKELTNKLYWDENDGIYYDILKKTPHTPVKVKTPAAYWAMLADIPSKNQAQKMASLVEDPNIFGGAHPLPSVSFDDPEFIPHGRYWRGSIWLPTTYMATKALERYGFYEIADSAAYRLLVSMSNTYKNYSPHTIWECYSPTEDKPGTYKKQMDISRPDFCGWSALGPISMFIENILGFHVINGVENRIKWRLYQKERHGIKQLKFGSIITDIIYDGSKVDVISNAPYSLEINGKDFEIHEGSQILSVSSE
jgi:glycogen debranching enzyme